MGATDEENWWILKGLGVFESKAESWEQNEIVKSKNESRNGFYWGNLKKVMGLAVIVTPEICKIFNFQYDGICPFVIVYGLMKSLKVNINKFRPNLLSNFNVLVMTTKLHSRNEV